MSYNPQILEPPEDPNAIWCDYCGELITEREIDYEEIHWLPDGRVVHKDDCILQVADALVDEVRRLKERIANMTEKVI